MGAFLNRISGKTHEYVYIKLILCNRRSTYKRQGRGRQPCLGDSFIVNNFKWGPLLLLHIKLKICSENLKNLNFGFNFVWGLQFFMVF